MFNKARDYQAVTGLAFCWQNFVKSSSVLKNYFTVAWRNIVRNKAFSFINIFGLSVGLSTTLLIILYIFDETGYDQHHVGADRIYRVGLRGGKDQEAWAAQPAPVAWALKADFPEVEQVTRLLKVPNMDKALFSYDNHGETRKFFESNGYYVDSTFFDLFTYDFAHGTASSVFSEPNSMVISQTIASNLFGSDDPIGKQVKIGLPFGDFFYTVKGVFRNTAVRSHIPAHFFLSMRNNDIGSWVDMQTNWATTNIFHTYVKFRGAIDPPAFEKKLQLFLDRRGGPDLKAAAASKSLFLQPLTDIYLHSNIGDEIGPTGNIKYLYILGTIAMFILLIASVNFMNLSTARSEKRGQEVGVRKVLGANRSSLVKQFMGESLLISLMALGVSAILAMLMLPAFNVFTQKNLRLTDQPKAIACMVLLTILTAILSGLYPAFYLSSFKPTSVLKRRLSNRLSAATIRKGLVIFQFATSICLCFAALVISRQLQYLNMQDLGFAKGQQIVIPLQSKETASRYNTLKDNLMTIASVRLVTSGSSYPGIPNINDMMFYADGKTLKNAVDVSMATIENDYFPVVGLRLLKGRTFSADFTADSAGIILNERSIDELGFTAATAVGKTIHYDFDGAHRNMQIVGVVKDFHFESSHTPIKPFGFSTENFFANKYNYVIVASQTKDYAALLSAVQRSWTIVNPGVPFVYSFLDEDFQRNYEKDQKTSSLVIYFTVVAILIACLGLLGLAAFSAEQRTREIGIRKVLGASVVSISTQLVKQFVGLVIIAVIISSPLSWYIMNKWLETFAYRITLTWWMFGAAGLVALILAVLTVGFQSIKAALANPIKSLRTE